MRLGEVLCLTHADWHPGSGGTPFIQVVPRSHPHGARVKGGRGRRIYVSDELERLYGDYLWDLAERAGRAGFEVSDEWFCFVNLDGEPRFAPLRPETVYKVVGRLRRELPGLPEGWSPHWLRHTHASALLAGVPLHVVSRRLGHADVQTTMDLYGCGARPPRVPGPGPPGVPAHDHIAVPAEHGIRAHHQVQSLEHVPREPVQQRRQQRPITRGEPHPVRTELPLQDRELMAQREDLRVFVPAAHRQQPQQRETFVTPR